MRYTAAALTFSPSSLGPAPMPLPTPVEWLERISRPGGLGGPNPHNPEAVRVYEAEVSLMLLETVLTQQQRIARLEEALASDTKK